MLKPSPIAADARAPSSMPSVVAAYRSRPIAACKVSPR
jgi:hypothetical protein